ncbi:MAG: tetratricopeptide repeat protein [Anaerolineaceae bacterium]|nr:tetratricopeptide repeat protein [Anaerolineaceae bacterium]
MAGTTPQQIHEALFTHFNLDELRTLCFQLDVRYDDLSGDTLTNKTLSLVEYARRHGRFNDLVAAVQKARPHLELTAGAVSTFPLHHIPFPPNPNFTGRKGLLQTLHQQLSQGVTTTVTQAIAGLGGVGKTQLALQYCHQQREHYGLIYWLRAEEESTLAADLAALARALGVAAAADTDLEQVRQRLHRWLAASDHRWLLVADNADDMAPRTIRQMLPPSGNGAVLITSRNPNWGGAAKVLTLGVFTAAEAAAFWQERLGGEGDDAAAAALAQELGYLPLALEHAAAYVEETGSNLAHYRMLYRAQRQRLWAKAEPPDAYHATVATTWELAFEKVRPTPGAVALLDLCSFLAPEDIPLSLLTASPGVLPPQLAEVSADLLALDEAVAALRRYSLLQRSGDLLAVHRLVRAVVRERMGAQRRREWAEVAMTLLVNNWSFEVQDMSTWPASAALLPHMMAVAERAAQEAVQDNHAAAVNREIGVYLQQFGDYNAARPYYERALTIREAALGSDHPETAQILNNLGDLLRAMGDHAGARSYLGQAVTIREAVLGPNHFHTADSLDNLGNLLHDMGDYDGARPCLERALAIREAAFGLDHPKTAYSHNNLGELLHSMGDYDGARPHLERALAIRETALGPNHPETASSLNNLGGLLVIVKDLSGARRYFERALAIREAALGPKHLDTAVSMNNLGYLLQAMGDLSGALSYYENTLAILETVFGLDHPLTAACLNNLGKLLLDMGDYKEAQPYLEQALAIWVEVLGPEHHLTAVAHTNLGRLLLKTKEHARAQSHLERALTIRERALGPDHPETGDSLNSLGELLVELGELATARPYLERALHILEEKLGTEHPRTQAVQENWERLQTQINEVQE